MHTRDRHRPNIDALETASGLYRQGRAALERGDTDAAIEKLRAAAAVSPHFKTYELLGECLLGRGEISDAILWLSAAAGFGNGQARARFLLAKAMLAIGEPTQAVFKLDEALAIQPSYKSARVLREEVVRDNPSTASYLGELEGELVWYDDEPGERDSAAP